MTPKEYYLETLKIQSLGPTRPFIWKDSLPQGRVKSRTETLGQNYGISLSNFNDNKCSGQNVGPDHHPFSSNFPRGDFNCLHCPGEGRGLGSTVCLTSYLNPNVTLASCFISLSWFHWQNGGEKI